MACYTCIHTRKRLYKVLVDFEGVCITNLSKLNMTIEKTLEVRLRKEVEKLGGIAIKYTSQTGIGYPDRIVLLPGGKAYFVELKSGSKGVVTPMQNMRIRSLYYLGFDARIISTREALDDFLQTLKNQSANE